MIQGLGPKKVRRLYEVMNEPFSVKKKEMRKKRLAKEAEIEDDRLEALRRKVATKEEEAIAMDELIKYQAEEDAMENPDIENCKDVNED